MDFDESCRPREGCGLHLIDPDSIDESAISCRPREGCGLHLEQGKRTSPVIIELPSP